MAERPAHTADYHLQAKQPMEQPRRYNCLLVREVPSSYDSKDIEKAFTMSCRSPPEPVSVSRDQTATSADAIVTVPAGPLTLQA